MRQKQKETSGQRICCRITGVVPSVLITSPDAYMYDNVYLFLVVAE